MLTTSIALSLLSALSAGSGSPLSAGPERPADSPGVAEAWLELDSEISSLAPTSTRNDSGLKIGGRVVATYQKSSDMFYESGGGEDADGFVLRKVRPEVSGQVGDYKFKVSFDGAGGTFKLKDAFVDWMCSDRLQVRWGQFKQPLLWSGMVSSKYLIFFDRSNPGGQNDGRDVGVRFRADWDKFTGIVAAQNGLNGQFGDIHVTGRIEYTAAGEVFRKNEGAWGQPEGLSLGGAFAFSDNGTVDEGTVQAAELVLGNDRLHFHGDIAMYDEDFDMSGGAAVGNDPDEILGGSKADTSPFGATLSYLFGEGEYEAAVRAENFDDDDDTGRLSFAINWFDAEKGHKKKWQLVYSDVSSDVDAFDGQRFELGLVLVY